MMRGRFKGDYFYSNRKMDKTVSLRIGDKEIEILEKLYPGKTLSYAILIAQGAHFKESKSVLGGQRVMYLNIDNEVVI